MAFGRHDLKDAQRFYAFELERGGQKCLTGVRSPLWFEK